MAKGQKARPLAKAVELNRARRKGRSSALSSVASSVVSSAYSTPFSSRAPSRASSPCRKGSFPFMRLPAELRLKIYEYALHTGKVIDLGRTLRSLPQLGVQC